MNLILMWAFIILTDIATICVAKFQNIISIIIWLLLAILTSIFILRVYNELLERVK